jgi:hypothetical protein
MSDNDNASPLSSNQKLLFRLFPDALLILILTATCYTLTFWYEAGVCSYFGLNPAFIHPDPSLMLGYGMGGIFALVLLFASIAMLMRYGRTGISSAHSRPTDLKHRVGFGVLIVLMVILGSMLVLTIEYVRGFRDRVMLLMCSVFFACVLIPPFIASKCQREKRSYYDCLSKHAAEFTALDNPKTHYNIMTIILVITLLYIFCGVSYIYGKYQASREDTFYYRDAPRHELVVRVYGSTAITARTENATNVYPDFCFIKLEGETNGFKLGKIGKLRPQLPK